MTIVHLAQTVDDLEQIDEAIDTSAVTAWEALAALVIALIAWPISLLVDRVTRRVVRRIPATPDYVPELAGRSARVLVLLIAAAWAMSLLGVDVGWFALVIALVAVVVFLMIKPLIENLAAGLLLQSRPSFAVGDEIATNGYVGDVLAINARSTVIGTSDGRRIHIPNQDVLDNAIDVYTAFESRRSALEIGIDYNADLSRATDLLVSTASRVDGVRSDPAPSALVTGFGDGTVVVELRWWHDSDLSTEGGVLDGVARAVKAALDEAGIAMPSREIKVTGLDDEP